MDKEMENKDGSTTAGEEDDEPPSSPKFTVLTSVQYDILDISDGPYERMDVISNADFDDSNQVTSTTESFPFRSSTINQSDECLVLCKNNTIGTIVLPSHNETTEIVELSSNNESFETVKLPSNNETIETADFLFHNENLIVTDATPGRSKYGRVRKQKRLHDFVSVDKKSFAVLNSKSYEISLSSHIVTKTTPVKKRIKIPKTPLSEKSKRGRPRKSELMQSTVSPVVFTDSTKKKTYETITHPATIRKHEILPLVDHPNENSLVDDSSSLSSRSLCTIKTYSRKNDGSAIGIFNVEQNTSTMPNFNYTELDWKVGDLAWAKIGCYSYWPSIVTLEHGTSIYAKSVGKKLNRIALHIQFFGDRGRRSWVLTTSLIKYESKEQFFQLKKQFVKDKIRFKYFIVQPRYRYLWEKAITEANTFLKLPNDERIKYYQNMYPTTEETYAAELATINRIKRAYIRHRKKNPLEKRGRKRKINCLEKGGVKRKMKHDADIQVIKKKRGRPRLIKPNDSITKEETEKNRESYDEHIKKRRAFMRRMNQILKQSKANKSLPLKKRVKKATTDQFNKLLGNSKLKTDHNTSSLVSDDSDSKKNDLSVYDFESDEELDIFIGTYNSKFTPQILTKIEEKPDSDTEQLKRPDISIIPVTKIETSAVSLISTTDTSIESEEKTESSSGSKIASQTSELIKKPKKSLVTTQINEVSKSEKRKRGRPKKKPLKLEKIKRPRGRPRKRNLPESNEREHIAKNQKNGEANLMKGGRGKSKKIENNVYEDFCAKVLEEMAIEHSDLNKEDIEKLILKLWTSRETNRKSNNSPQVFDVSSGDESKSEEDKRRSSSPQGTTSSRLKKSSNIFKTWIKAEKVCQICAKSGDVLRCRGPCAGNFHVECAANGENNAPKIPTPQRGRKRLLPKDSNSSLVKTDYIGNATLVKEEVNTETSLTNKLPDDRECSEKSKADQQNFNYMNVLDAPLNNWVTQQCESNELNSEASPKVISKQVSKGNFLSMDIMESTTHGMLSVDLLKEECERSTNLPVRYTDSVTSTDNVEIAEMSGDNGKDKSSELVKLVENQAAVQDEEVDDKTAKTRETTENEISSSTGIDCHERVEETEIDMNIGLDEEIEKNADTGEKVDSPLEDLPKSDDSSTETGSGSVKSSNGNIDFRCKKCLENRMYPCFSCGNEVEDKTGETTRYGCHLTTCGRVYHKECLEAWPQATWGAGPSKESLRCPQHYCHTCISENPVVLKHRQCNEGLVKCIRCPTSYHRRVHCLPAGTEILSTSQVLCPRHYEPPPEGKHTHFNTSWCFICCHGGTLICCDECPTSFHVECLKLRPEEYEGRYICDDCSNGRFLLYGEIAWVKLGHYRWWPAKVLCPQEVPENLLNLQHRRGEFVVKFFGSHNYNWVNRGRAFLYQEGDSGKKSCRRSAVDLTFEKAMTEAEEAFKKLLVDKAARDQKSKSVTKPPRYVKIKANKPVGNVRIVEMNSSNTTACECDPISERPCAPDSVCLNRMLSVECNPLICPAGERCMNQAFEKRIYPPLVPYKTDKRGWGLKTLVDLKRGDFIIEYVGEMIDEDEYKRRVSIMHKNQEENYYFLTIDKDRMLDAGPKGNVARFMNHSCNPNCETRKWTVNGDTRVGIFALKDVAAGDELVFNYNLTIRGNEKKPCYCGAENCSGYIGIKASKQNGNSSTDEEIRKRSNEELRKRLAEDDLYRPSKRSKHTFKKFKHRHPPGAVMKRAVPNVRSTDMRFRKCLKNLNRKMRIIHKFAANKPKMPEAKQANSGAPNGNEYITNRQSSNLLDQLGLQSVTVESSSVKKKIAAPSKSKRKLGCSMIKFKRRLHGDPSRRVCRRRGRTQYEETSILKSCSPVGQYVSPQLKSLFTKKESYIKDLTKTSSTHLNKVGAPRVERRGRKKMPKSEQEKQELLYEVIKRRVDRKLDKMALSAVENKCFKCRQEGELLFCDNNYCPKAYHLPCIDRNSWPTGRWLCPWHYCCKCSSRRHVLKCEDCIRAYCILHQIGNIFPEDEGRHACKEHCKKPVKMASKLTDEKHQTSIGISNSDEKIASVNHNVKINTLSTLITDGPSKSDSVQILFNKKINLIGKRTVTKADDLTVVEVVPVNSNNGQTEPSNSMIKTEEHKEDGDISENKCNSGIIRKISRTARKSVQSSARNFSIVENYQETLCQENTESSQDDVQETDIFVVDEIEISDDEYIDLEVEIINEIDDSN